MMTNHVASWRRVVLSKSVYLMSESTADSKCSNNSPEIPLRLKGSRSNDKETSMKILLSVLGPSFPWRSERLLDRFGSAILIKVLLYCLILQSRNGQKVARTSKEMKGQAHETSNETSSANRYLPAPPTVTTFSATTQPHFLGFGLVDQDWFLFECSGEFRNIRFHNQRILSYSGEFRNIELLHGTVLQSNEWNSPLIVSSAGL